MSLQTPDFLSLSQWLGMPTDEVGSAVKQAMASLRVAMVCIVQTFDPGDGATTPPTVTVLPAVMEKTYQNVGGAMIPQDFRWEHPFRATVVVAGGGGWFQTFPIKAGDECLVIFNDNALDAWRQSGGVNNVQLPPLRRHNFADGVAIFSPHSAAVPIPDYNTTGPELRNKAGTIKLAASDTGIAITGTLTVTGDLAVGDVPSYLAHTHSGGTIGGETGPPVP